MKNKLKTIVEFSGRKIKKKRVTVVKTRMNKRCCNCFSSSKIKSATNTPKITSMTETRFRDGRYGVRHRQSGVKDDPKIASSRSRCDRDVRRHSKDRIG